MSTVKVLLDGTKCWTENGQFHREDGPAIIKPDGTQSWYKHGKLHREEGPARIHADGTKEYWLNDNFYTITKLDL